MAVLHYCKQSSSQIWHTMLIALLLQACSGRGPNLQANDCPELLLEVSRLFYALVHLDNCAVQSEPRPFNNTCLSPSCVWLWKG